MKIGSKLIPIIMTPLTVRLTLLRCKNQTRRVIRLRGDEITDMIPNADPGSGVWNFVTRRFESRTVRCRYGAPGDFLYVKESYFAYGEYSQSSDAEGKTTRRFRDLTVGKSGYKYADAPPALIRKFSDNDLGWYFKPGIYMPLRAARIFLKVKDVRAELLQSMTEADAVAEGVRRKPGTNVYFLGENADEPDAVVCGNPVNCYSRLWNEINDPRSFGWIRNPWVWAVTYELLNEKPDLGLAK